MTDRRFAQENDEWGCADCGATYQRHSDVPSDCQEDTVSVEWNESRQCYVTTYTGWDE